MWKSVENSRILVFIDNFNSFKCGMWKTLKNFLLKCGKLLSIMYLHFRGIMASFDYYYNDLWQATLQSLSKSDKIADNVFDEWFLDTKLVNTDVKGPVVVCKNYITKSILTQYKTLIETYLIENNNGREIDLSILTEEELEGLLPQNVKNDFIYRNLNLDQNFSNFIVGKSNMQAQVASLTCSKNLGLMYNPLFIYGNSGLGKTHLLNAIGNEVRSTYPYAKIGFIAGQDFIDALMKASNDKTIDEFKESFEDLDLLLIDDIQFIAKRPFPQEVFFSIFSKLVNNRKQICMTADKKPKEISGIEERLLSRFNQGLNVNIESPEYETSIKILKMKIANNVSITEQIDDDVLSYIASTYSQDVRSLEGAINRLLFYYIGFRGPDDDHITLKLAKEAFKDDNEEIKNELSISKIRKTVCDYYNITKQQITSANRTKNIAIPRHIAMYLCRKLLDAPYKEIGNEFGKRDHSTVISAIEKVEQLIKTDSTYLTAINDIERRIK